MQATIMSQADDATIAAMRAHMEALPVDDEPITPEELAAIEEGRRDIAEGRCLTSEQLRAELGIE